MKALVCREFQSLEHLKIEELPSPVPEKGQVLVSV